MQSSEIDTPRLVKLLNQVTKVIERKQYFVVTTKNLLGEVEDAKIFLLGKGEDSLFGFDLETQS